MSKLDMYSQKITDACALIREVSGGSEYFMVFDRHPESVLEFFVAAMAEVEKQATEKAAIRIAELTAQFDAANSLIKDMRHQITKDTATINNLNERLLNAAQDTARAASPEGYVLTPDLSLMTRYSHKASDIDLGRVNSYPNCEGKWVRFSDVNALLSSSIAQAKKEQE